MIKYDIENRKDIQILIEQFYNKLMEDELLKEIFNNTVKSHLDAHLEVIIDFWENILFQTGSYTGNTMAVHLKLHEQFPLNETHFNRWLFLLQETVHEMFEGGNANQVLQSATSIAMVIQVKINRHDMLL